MSDTPEPTELDENNTRRDSGRNQHIMGASILTGAVSIIASFVALLLDLASGDYGGVGPMAFLCVGLPSGFFGMVAGFVWQKIRKVSRLEIVDLIILAIVGIIVGMIPFAFIKSLSQ